MAGYSIEDHLAAAMRCRRSGQATAARRHLEEIVALDPVQPLARNLLGLDALANGDARAAADHFEQACRGDSEAAELWLNLARARAELDDVEGARSALESALSIDQRFLPALIGLAQLHEELGEDGPATERWTAVLALTASMNRSEPGLGEMVAHARAFVERQRQLLGGGVDHAIERDLASASNRERRRIRAAADTMLGRRSIYTHECHGLHYPFLPADEFFDREHFPWLRELEAETDAIREELIALLASERGINYHGACIQIDGGITTG